MRGGWGKRWRLGGVSPIFPAIAPSPDPACLIFATSLRLPKLTNLSRDHAPRAKKILCDFALFALNCFVAPCFICSYSRTFVSA